MTDTVKFVRCNQDKYDSIEKDDSTLYFILDKGKIYQGTVLVSNSKQDFVIHEDNYLHLSSSPYDMPLGEHACYIDDEIELLHSPTLSTFGNAPGILRSIRQPNSIYISVQIWITPERTIYLRFPDPEYPEYWGGWDKVETTESVRDIVRRSEQSIIGAPTEDFAVTSIYDAVLYTNEIVNSSVAQALIDSKSYTDQELATFDFIKIGPLPETGLPNRFYFVPKQETQTQDLFDEYAWVNRGTTEEPDWDWEWITTKQIEVDLTNYTTINKVEELILERSKKEHEVGSLYVSMNSTNPAQIFGFGTWALIAKNRFLVGAGDDYEAGATGGEASHKLTAAELPKQNGTISTHGTYSGSPIAAVTGVFGARHTVSDKYMNGSTSGHSSIDVIEYGNGGEDKAHNNLPPYLAVYIWQRTA